MSQPTRRVPARRLDTAALAPIVPELAPETLHQLIQHHGIEDSGALIAAATPEQITRVLDLDLWRTRQEGADAVFDADRFGEWVEALADHDPAEAARVVAGLDPQLVAVGLSRFIRVLDLAVLTSSAETDDEPPLRDDRVPGPSCELAGFMIRARRGDAWDAIIGLLSALLTDDPSTFRTTMRACRCLSDAGRELDGLDNLLETPEQWLHDVALARDERQAAQGYATPADARAFLELARQRGRARRSDAGGVVTPNVMASAYFRAADERVAPLAPASRQLTPAAGDDPAMVGARVAVAEWLADAGVTSDQPRVLLADPRGERVRFPHLQPLMTFVQDRDGAACQRRLDELAFLTNTMMAGGGVLDRAFTPAEASDAAVSLCNLGLEIQAGTSTLPATYLASHDLIAAFEVGWSTLYEDVTMTATEQLITALGRLRIADSGMLRDVHELRGRLRAHQARGTPWLARPILDVLAPFDTPSWMALVGLFNECPVITASLTAIVARHTGSVSATAFEFIATREQIGLVLRFLSRLPALLGG
jgi:hypothetical protein